MGTAVNTPPSKYRSAHHDKPRLVSPTGSRPRKAPIGTIQYHSSAPPLSEMLLQAKELNRTELCRVYERESAAVTLSLNALHALASFHMWTIASWADARPHPANDVLFTCFHKTLLSLHAAHELTLDGLYGMGRPHLRQSFESLMIAKWCATSPESDVFDRWIDGVDLYFTNGVLKKLQHPDIAEFSATWRLMCQWSHATVFASQLSLDIETTRDEAGLNIAFIGVFLHFLQHLLSTHILTPTVKYYATRYGRSGRGTEAKAELKSSLAVLAQDFGPASRRLVRNFKAAWKLK